MKDVIFYLGLGAPLTHELDAMTDHEWRVLPLYHLVGLIPVLAIVRRVARR